MVASKACINRLQKEYKAILKDPPPNIKAHPNPNNILEWHYVIEGHTDSDFQGGVYHGKLLFQPQYPFKAPGIMMMTPNGRFTTGSRLCLSMSDFHPESWNPLWSVGTILTGLFSFMLSDDITTGSMKASGPERRRLAEQSLETNLRDPTFRKLFPEYVEQRDERRETQKA